MKDQIDVQTNEQTSDRINVQSTAQKNFRSKAQRNAQPLSLLIKPASGLCNLKCEYCFYREEVAHLQDFHQKIMSDETMDILIQKVFESAGGQVQFTFQGGEPTMAGLEFFEKFTDRVEAELTRIAGDAPSRAHTATEKLYGDERRSAAETAARHRRKPQVSYAFQTNGILLDKSWTALFRKYHFLVGLSFDGTDRLHDRYRVGANGEKTAERVQAAWELLCKEKIDTNILCVVTGPMARSPEKVYRYLRKMGAGFWQFIPCMGGGTSHLDSSVKGEAASHRLQDWALEPKDYGYFLKGMFDLWYRDWKSGHYVSIRNFDDSIHLLCGQNASTCATCGDCGGYLAVEQDGSVYPCDFYVEDRWRLGNIRDASLNELRYGEKMQEFLRETREYHQNRRCEMCEFYRLCKGGCKHDERKVSDGSKGAIDEEANIFCEAFQDFFCYAMPRMNEIAQVEMEYLSWH